MKQDRIKKVKYYLKQLSTKGLDINKATLGKNVEQLAFNNKTLNEFIKRVKRVKERPKILDEVKKYDDNVRQKLKNKALILSAQQINDTNLAKKVWNIITKPDYQKEFPQFKNFDKIKNSKDMAKAYKELEKNPSIENIVEKITRDKAKDFYYKYFKELQHSPKDWERVERLVNGFGNRLDKFEQMTDFVLNRLMVFNMRDTNDVIQNDDEFGKFNEMRNRLDQFEMYQNLYMNNNIGG